MTPVFRSRPTVHRWALGLGITASLLLVDPSIRGQSSTAYPQDPTGAAADVDWSDEVPAHLSVVNGTVWLEREGQAERADENLALLAGDRLKTENGRVEVLYADGSVLDVDDRSDVEFLSDSLLRLRDGRIRLVLARSSAPIDYRVDAAGTSTDIRAAGEYRFSFEDGRGDTPDIRVAVLRGQAEVSTQSGRTLLRAGTEARANARQAPSLPYAVVASSDTFDRWIDDQYRERVGFQSVQYLPTEVRSYSGAFDRYGSWEYAQPYGYVWYPRVANDWRPYYDGRWQFTANFGWFWVGADRWSWPTHHYGRWGQVSNRWFWIPERHWAPAWVSWGSAPGYVSWCPLGYDNRAVFALSVSNYQTWNAWTVLPVRAFTPNVYVSRFAVRDRAEFQSRNLRFETWRSAPIRPTTVRLDERPLRAPGASRIAVPRQGQGRVVDVGPAGGSRTQPGAGSVRGADRGDLPAGNAGGAASRSVGARTPSRVPDAGTAPSPQGSSRASVRPGTPQGAPSAPSSTIDRRAGPSVPSGGDPAGRTSPSRTEGRPAVGRRLPEAPPAPGGSSAPARIERRAPAQSAPAPEPEVWRSRQPSAGSAPPAPSERRSAEPRGPAPSAPAPSRAEPSRAPERAPDRSGPARVERSAPSAPAPSSGGGDRRAVPRGGSR